jgi:chaperone BCS1
MDDPIGIYLIYVSFTGAPGSGKTSIIQALAGELGLHIYVVSLSKRGMDDTILSTLINSIPSRAIILMEDIDATFTNLTRESAQPVNNSSTNPYNMGMPMGMSSLPPPSSITLSGLLNAIDGVQAQQGRLLFATTNKYDSLDPALVRPGRLDLHIEFRLATKWQAGELFKRFYPIEKGPPTTAASTTGTTVTTGASIATFSKDQENSGIEPQIFTSPTTKSRASAVSPSFANGNLTEKAPAALDSENQDSLLTPKQRGRKAPKLTQQELDDLAQRFADAIPHEELSMAYVSLLHLRMALPRVQFVSLTPVVVFLLFCPVQSKRI